MALSESKIRQLRAKKQTYEVGDYECLYLRITPAGTKTWFFRPRGAGAKKVTLGRWPELGLFDARAARDRARVQAQELAAARVLFADLAMDYMAKMARPYLVPARTRQLDGYLKRTILPAFGELNAASITPPMVLRVGRQLIDQGRVATAHAVISLIGQIMRYGIPQGLLESDPTRDLRDALPTAQTQHFATVTEPKKIGELLRGLETIQKPIVRLALMLSAHVFLRPSELRLGRWDEIDLDRRLWTIPAQRMKKRREHLVPLSRQVLEMLDELRQHTGHSEVLFLSRSGKNRPVSRTPLIMALHALGYSENDMTLHGFRSMASTRLNEAQWPSDIIELQLAHVEGNAVRATYNRAQHLDQRRVMMQWWSDYLDALRDGRPEPPKP